MTYVFPPFPISSLPIQGGDTRFPIRRVFCVGRNYADHAREMGAHDQADGREPPFFFMKPADAMLASAETVVIPFPTKTDNLHHEVEMVVALGHGGADIPVEQTLNHVFGYAVGLDLTRRDVQARAKEKGHPWDMGKGFDGSAVSGPLLPVGSGGHPESARIWLKVNGQERQTGNISSMIWNVPEIIANLSQWVRLEAGDLVYTGTPAGVGRLVPGDRLEAGVDGLPGLVAKIV